MKQKIKIVCADAIKYMASVKKANTIIVCGHLGGRRGRCRQVYRYKKYEAQLHGTKFSYWIEDEIRGILAMKYDCIVIGGGASGMAVAAAVRGRTLVIERNERLGKNFPLPVTDKAT